MYVNKSQRVPVLHFSALCNIFRKKKSIFNIFPVGEKMVSESYRAWKEPFGCLEIVFWAFHEYVLDMF